MLIAIISTSCASAMFSYITVNLISAIFMNTLPVEFVAILASLIGAACGGINLMWMGIFCYLTEITEEKDRVFR